MKKVMYLPPSRVKKTPNTQSGATQASAPVPRKQTTNFNRNLLRYDGISVPVVDIRLLHILVSLDPALDVDVGHVTLRDGRVLLHHHLEHVIQHHPQLVPGRRHGSKLGTSREPNPGPVGYRY